MKAVTTHTGEPVVSQGPAGTVQETFKKETLYKVLS